MLWSHQYKIRTKSVDLYKIRTKSLGFGKDNKTECFSNVHLHLVPKVAEWKSLFVRITGKHKPSDWFFSPSNLLLHEFLIHNHWKLTPATTHVWQANNISTAQLNSVAVAGREAAARRPPSYPIQSSPVSRG